ncbi:MAG: hypothetical protein ACI3XS_01075 [Eubacteriales bacterium]
MGDNAVISYIISRWLLWIIVLIILIAVFVVFSLIQRIKKYRWILLVPLLLLTIYIAIPTVQGLTDISQGSYITEQVQYYRADEANTRNSITASQTVQITTADGKTVILRGADNSFPYGEFSGIVTYAKRSRVIVDFVPD